MTLPRPELQLDALDPHADRVIRLILPEPPSSNRYWRHVVIRGQARVLLSTAARQYRAEVAGLVARDRIRPLNGPVAVTVTWDRSRRAGDLDNRMKQLWDALKGLAFGDDADIIEIHAYRTDQGTGTVRIELRRAA